jgi:hypothetical protein
MAGEFIVRTIAGNSMTLDSKNVVWNVTRQWLPPVLACASRSATNTRTFLMTVSQSEPIMIASCVAAVAPLNEIFVSDVTGTMRRAHQQDQRNRLQRLR